MLWVLFSVNIVKAENADLKWDSYTKATWLTFKTNPNMIDSCALKIAHGVNINKNTDWPAYCFNFGDTALVKQRVDEIKLELSRIANKEEKEKLADERIWVGASSKFAELSWGRPLKINRTVKNGKTMERWVYDIGIYIYIVNGTITGYQN
jgi:hypothetical protein